MAVRTRLRLARGAIPGAAVAMLLVQQPAFSQSLSFAPSGIAATALPFAVSNDFAVPNDNDLPAPLRRQVVTYTTDQPPGTIIVDTANTFLYLTLGGGKAIRYGIGVGRQGFTWSGVETISRKSAWPDWIPPAEMITRQPYLPRWVAGGPGNPLGARALYLGNTAYRIHGTNNPASIGKHVSSGCIRMDNADVIDLYDRVNIGATVVVLPSKLRQTVADDRNGTATASEPRVAADSRRAAPMTTLIAAPPAVESALSRNGLRASGALPGLY